MSNNKFQNTLKKISMEIENTDCENIEKWIEENIVHIQNNNELIYTYGSPSIRIYIDSGVIVGCEDFGSETIYVSVNTEVFEEYFDSF